MRRPGTVIGVRGAYAQVKMEKGVSCGEKGCPLSTSWVDSSQSDFYVLNARNCVGASIGDMVLVELRDSTALSTAFLVYLFPVIWVLVTYLVLHLFVRSSMILVLGVLGSVAALVFFIRWVDRSFSPDYRIVDFLNTEDCCSCPLIKREESTSVLPSSKFR
ncbi:MAG: SoxR reducing system RseC family protein [Atribacterota bacterium]|nr:SoxR reducing system RseC family protein [Atribacterota bacterium]